MDVYEVSDTHGNASVQPTLEDAKHRAKRWHGRGRIYWEIQSDGRWYGYAKPAHKADPEDLPLYEIRRRARS